MKMALSNGPDKPFTSQDAAQRAYKNDIWRPQFLVPEGTIQAATAAVQGLAGGNAAQSGGTALYLAEVVKTMTTVPGYR